MKPVPPIASFTGLYSQFQRALGERASVRAARHLQPELQDDPDAPKRRLSARCLSIAADYGDAGAAEVLREIDQARRRRPGHPQRRGQDHAGQPDPALNWSRRGPAPRPMAATSARARFAVGGDRPASCIARPHLHGSVRDNIRYGAPDDGSSRSSYGRGGERDDFIATCPRYEDGRRSASAGEAERRPSASVAIARAHQGPAHPHLG